MSIKFDARYDQYAYRVSGPLNKAVTALNEGQFVTVNAAGEYILADGAAKAAWMTTSSMRAGRDQLKGQTHKIITVLKGKVCNIKTDQYDAAGDYSTSPVTKLKLDGTGKLPRKGAGLPVRTGSAHNRAGDHLPRNGGGSH